ncbi:MAG: response regulator [Bacteroidetes bacterium]|nr:MAG: response regulator [Bacteroidota bacterium]REK06462.1 MAG: response regulator [Bacteroidota bacterium]REK33228.1 MAG: response regulator [Bacteroidota bacterium]REK47065.1 MAG: response regulator [Bacteroidota bacterium]
MEGIIKKKSVLILDDEPDICWLLSGFLEKMGFITATAYNLKEGQKMLYANSSDIILLDINLPDGSGLQKLEEFKSISPSSDFIVMSAHATSIEERIAINSGASGFISKPIDLLHLNQLISSLKDKSI